MKPLRSAVGALALGLAAVASPAEAGWNNVFQVTCWNCNPRSPSVSGYYVAPAYSPPAVSAYSSPGGCCDPCPQQCTTKYVQRCYYQPVTSYTTKTYYEPVTTYQTKYFYEPVTSYRYTCQYDPCTGCPQQVACPVTSYQLPSWRWSPMLRHSPESSTEPSLTVPLLFPMIAMTAPVWMTRPKGRLPGGGPSDQPWPIIVVAVCSK